MFPVPGFTAEGLIRRLQLVLQHSRAIPPPPRGGAWRVGYKQANSRQGLFRPFLCLSSLMTDWRMEQEIPVQSFGTNRCEEGRQALDSVLRHSSVSIVEPFNKSPL